MSEAVARLARSRLAIVEQMRPASQRLAGGQPAGCIARLGHATSAWWRHHPVHLVLDVAKPVVSYFAARYPFGFLAVAAASGALIDRARPWRLLSGSGVIAIAKSLQLSRLVLPALSALRRPRL
jgi:hypothetical protein